MTSPAFSSFPSFSSFPELEPGPGNRRSPSPPRCDPKGEKRKTAKGKKDKHKRDKHSHSYDSQSAVQYDERLKAEEDRQRKDVSAVFYTDRKGDRLNVRYGGLHAGDVPKYRLVGGRFGLAFPADN